MNKEILEITKKFHDTYEKLASEYTYGTREDTKVFDINSNNGKLMYATVNEIVSPILKENKILRENAEHNDKVVDKVNWENLKLKEQVDYLRRSIERKEEIIMDVQNEIIPYTHEYVTKLINRQNNFIEYLENEKNIYPYDISDCVYEDIINTILSKYYEIIKK